MCGRYVFVATKDELVERCAVKRQLELDFHANYNVAPTQTMPIVRADGEQNALVPMRWGLIPFWAKDAQIAYKTINARAEGVEDKPSYRHSFRTKRCLVPASGFYEWQRQGSTKQPFYISLKDAPLFAFAGLSASWHDPQADKDVETYTIITTTPNALMAPIHDRMPVILQRQHEEAWLNPELQDPTLLHSFLTPYAADAMQAVPVSPAVNTVNVNNNTLIQPINSQ